MHLGGHGIVNVHQLVVTVKEDIVLSQNIVFTWLLNPPQVTVYHIHLGRCTHRIAVTFE